MNVLSLFDGISCGQIALKRAGIQVDNYYASEIDSNAIKITQKNYPNTIQLGDVKNWKSWDLKDIDLIIGGSPCQGFSFAGKQLNFEDPRSKLFFDFVDILNDIKPTFFMMENVKMNINSQNIISEYLGVQPIIINSNLVSAQNRKRLYWTNIPNIAQPVDKGILLKDIIWSGAVYEDKSATIKQQYQQSSKANFIRQGTFHSTGICVALGGKVTKDNIKLEVDIQQDISCKKVKLIKKGQDWISADEAIWRKLTPSECEKLQTLPINYTQGFTNNHRYQAIGNGWTVDIISHIFKGMN